MNSNNPTDDEAFTDLPDDGPYLAEEGAFWVRFPSGNGTVCGLKRAALRALADRKKISAVNISPQDGKKSIKLIFLPSLEEYLAAEYRRQNFKDREPTKEFLDLIDVALFDGAEATSITLETDEIRDILFSHPATSERASMLLIGRRSTLIYLQSLAEFCPKRVWRETLKHKTLSTYWTIWRP